MKKLLILSLILSLTGCSVFMAANKSGVDPQTILACKTRTCLITAGATSIEKPAKNEEIFKAKKPTGSTSRAVLNGTLDVFTLGLWEAAGTPIEGSLDKDTDYAFKAIYESDGETIKGIKQ